MSSQKALAKARAVNWAKGLLEEGFRVVDFETTGIGSKAEIVQVSIIDQTGTTLLDTFIKPVDRISPDAMAVHGITHDMVADAPPYTAVVEQIVAVLDGQVFVAYNVDFERNIIKGVHRRHDLPALRPSRWECAMLTYAGYWGAWNNRRRSFAWQRLTDACTQQGIVVKDAHSAAGDVLMTLALIKKMAGMEL